MKEIVPQEIIQQEIFLIRGHKVMLDSDLAKFYGIATKVLLQAVKRNLERFPGDLLRFRTVSDNSRLMIWEARAAVYNRISELDPLQKFSFKKFIRKHAHRKKPKSKELKPTSHIVIQKKKKRNG